MKQLAFLTVLFFIAANSFAQMDLPPSGNNPRATVTETVGITSITLSYSRPDVNKREGKIYGDGKLVTLVLLLPIYSPEKIHNLGAPVLMKILLSPLNMM